MTNSIYISFMRVYFLDQLIPGCEIYKILALVEVVCRKKLLILEHLNTTGDWTCMILWKSACKQQLFVNSCTMYILSRDKI